METTKTVQKTKLPHEIKEVKVVAYMAAITMIILSAAGIKAIITEPRVVTNHEVVMMPSDSLVSIQAQLVTLQAHLSAVEDIAAIRLQIINNLAGAVKGLGDTLSSLDSLYAGNQKYLQQEGEKREAINTQLLAKMDKLEDNYNTVTTTVIHSSHPDFIIKHDTVYATLPEEHPNFWKRLRFLIRGK